MKEIYSQPKKIGNIEVKNRFVRSATGERLASEKGEVTEELIQFHKILAEGGVGLIITGVTYVHANGIGIPNQLGIDRDNLIPGLRRLTEVVHKYGDGCKIVVQLHHSGRQSMILENPLAPSAVFEPTLSTTFIICLNLSSLSRLLKLQEEQRNQALMLSNFMLLMDISSVNFYHPILIDDQMIMVVLLIIDIR